MNENAITYADVKYLPSKKKQKNKRKEQLIYSEVKTFSNSNHTKITRTKSSKEKGPSVPFNWYLAVVILGISCFFLLLTTGILVFQGLQKCSSDNVAQYNSTFKNITSKEEPLNTGSKKSTCKSKWSCCEEKCYYFSQHLKNFEESKQFCKEMDSTLLKIEDEKELKFIQSQLSSLSWIGLTRKGSSSLWTWEDESQPPSNLLSQYWEESEKGHCARMTTTKFAIFDCSKIATYICEKKCVGFCRLKMRPE